MKYYTMLLSLWLALFISVEPGSCYGNILNIIDTTVIVPLGGNTWCGQCNDKSQLVTKQGIQNWSQDDVEFDTWVRISRPGVIRIGIEAKTDKEGTVQVSAAGTPRKITVKGVEIKTYDAGEFVVKDTGYIRITVAGLQKKGSYFADIVAYHLSGSAINASTAFVKNNEGNFFYWGRRGPSVHLGYPFADSLQAEWFYNEITVPENQDVTGSYFMANGFAEGYFGIQVNSSAERRVLFSVWSPFSTDDPKSIPEDMRIRLLKKGEGVYTGEFGNEGAGGQSYLRYNWKAGITYKFLLHGVPDGKGNTVYSAYFFTPEKNEWVLIASFERPKTNTWLKRFHSFLENFIPDQGNKSREVLFGNQWIRTSAGQWIELTRAVFTYDNTAAKGYRMDFAGGLQGNRFYLRNCGFFNEYTGYRSAFQRSADAKMPEINFNNLP
ncbi:MAG: DUF3472 domain-containing protein [Chitinophagaceae bacterium]|nr:DUF3472 domain-containing protein [Chitinophagaceae bacterium]